MTRPTLLALLLYLIPSLAHAQVSYDEAMERLRAKQAARQTTNPTTQPATETTTQPATRHATPPLADTPTPPPAPREFRSAWVASVDNANWPSTPNLTVDQQKKEMIDILDKCAAAHLNAIFFQVRPCADALYPSTLEPWSEYLTGTQGKPPEPLWDPLQTWIDESHQRGLELHAWFNPYRVKHFKSTGPIADTSIAKTHPDVVRSYGGYLWMDPGESLAEQHTLAVLADIVTRYDIDGIHTDDYYYPYKVRDAGKEVDFPDSATYQKYTAAGGKLALDDYRRDNVNRLVEKIYASVHAIKPWVRVSYAPFGIWKSGTPKGITGFSMYDGLYADAKLWLNKGWLDYISPQLYWKIGGQQDYAALLKWWASENTAHRHVWPGLGVSRHSPTELLNQIALTHQAAGTSAGVILWSVNTFLKRQEIYDALQHGPYAQPALVPACPWLDPAQPPAPAVTLDKHYQSITLTFTPDPAATTHAVWSHHGKTWSFSTFPGPATTITLDPTPDPVTSLVITAVSHTGIESPRVTLPVP